MPATSCSATAIGSGNATLLKATFYPDGEPTDVGVRESNPANPAIPDAVIVTHGRITREALAARERLATEGILVGILLCEYIKPYEALAEENLGEDLRAAEGVGPYERLKYNPTTVSTPAGSRKYTAFTSTQ